MVRLIPLLGTYTEESLKNLAGMKAEMKRRGLSLREVARRTGIGVTMIERFAANKIIPTTRYYNRLARLFGWKPLRGGEK